MALSDTAKLVASLTLEDKFTKPLKGADQSLSGFEKHASSLGKIGDQVSRGLGNTARNVGLIGAAAAGFLAIQVKAGLESLVVLESAQAQTEAVLKSTQSVAGQTADSIRNLAEKYEGLNATIDDKVIQSAENVLLTFTNIRKQGFEPALQAALDMNQALGGGEEGLQGTLILVAKALNDPIKGLVALQRKGVILTQSQKDQIKTLVSQNKLYDAQQIILDELAKRFGGSFARGGDTAAGKFAKVKDAVEDAQRALATAFLPLLTKVADKLTTFLADPATIARIRDFGDTLAGGLDRLISIGEKLPWQAIGNAFALAGTASNAILETFTSMPPWVQTAVLTGWGLNKLTGGALSGIVGALASGLVKGVLGINAGVVNINAASVNGGVPGVGGGKGPGGLTSLLGAGVVVTTVAGVVALIAAGEGAFGGDRARAQQIIFNRNSTTSGLLGGTGATNRPVAVTAPDLLTAQREGWAGLKSEFTRSRATAAQLANMQQTEAARRATAAAQTLDTLRGQAGTLMRISEKNFSPTINVRTQSNLYIAGRTVQAIITQQQLKVGTGPQEF